MADNNPGGPRNYYEEQFGDRIRDIVKGGQTPPPPSGSSGPSTGSGGGIGRSAGFVVLFLVIGVLRAVFSSNHRHTPPPPPPPRIQFPAFDQPGMDPDVAARLEELRQRLEKDKQRALGMPPVEANLPGVPGGRDIGVDGLPDPEAPPKDPGRGLDRFGRPDRKRDR